MTLSSIVTRSGIAGDKRAVTALEYGLIAAAIIAVCLAGFQLVGGNLNSLMTNQASTLANTGE